MEHLNDISLREAIMIRSNYLSPLLVLGPCVIEGVFCGDRSHDVSISGTEARTDSTFGKVLEAFRTLGAFDWM